jgi:hypothetical protein
VGVDTLVFLHNDAIMCDYTQVKREKRNAHACRRRRAALVRPRSRRDRFGLGCQPAWVETADLIEAAERGLRPERPILKLPITCALSAPQSGFFSITTGTNCRPDLACTALPFNEALCFKVPNTIASALNGVQAPLRYITRHAYRLRVFARLISMVCLKTLRPCSDLAPELRTL